MSNLFRSKTTGSLAFRLKGPVPVASFLPEGQFDPDIHHQTYHLLEFMDGSKAYIPEKHFLEDYRPVGSP